jgi:hypothetical protein
MARDHLHCDDPFGQRLVSRELSPAVTGAMAMLGQGSGDFCSPIVTRDGCAVRRLKGTHKLSSQGQYLVHLLATEYRWGPPLAPISPARLLAATLGKIHGKGKTLDPVEIDRHVAQLGAGVLSRSGRGNRCVRVLRSAKNQYSVFAGHNARETLAAELGLNDDRFVAKGRRCAQDVFLSALALVTPVASPAPVASIAETLASMELHAAASPPVPDLEPDVAIAQRPAAHRPAAHTPGAQMPTNGLENLQKFVVVKPSHHERARAALAKKNGKNGEKPKISKKKTSVTFFFLEHNPLVALFLINNQPFSYQNQL